MSISKLSAIALLASTGSAFAGLTVSTAAGTASGPFDPGAVIMSPAVNSPITNATVNQQQGPGNSLTQVFTVTSSFQLDRIVILAGGRAGSDGVLNIYPITESFVGGQEADGFVNVSFSTDLLNGGAGLGFTVFGNGGLNYTTFDLTDADQVTLNPGRYAIEFDVTGAAGGQFSWQRSAASEYTGGNLYQAATEAGFNGSGAANGRGNRNQVGGAPQRDAAFALYAVPEPSSLALLGLSGLAALRRRRA